MILHNKDVLPLMLSKLRYLLWEIANKYIVHGFNHGGEPLGCADCLNPHFLNAGAFLCNGYVPADMGRSDRKPLDSAVCRQLCAYAFIDYPALLCTSQLSAAIM